MDVRILVAAYIGGLTLLFLVLLVHIQRKMKPPTQDKMKRYTRRGSRIGINVRLFGTIDGVNPHLVSIGDNTVIGERAHIITHGPIKAGPVEIGRNVFIGYGALILPRVRVGDGAIIGAGSVVTRDVEPMTIVAGNPAKPIGRRSTHELSEYTSTIEAGGRLGDLSLSEIPAFSIKLTYNAFLKIPAILIGALENVRRRKDIHQRWRYLRRS